MNINHGWALDHCCACHDCEEMVPDQFLSFTPETEAFYKQISSDRNRGVKHDMTNVDPQILLCPTCRAVREQAINQRKAQSTSNNFAITALLRYYETGHHSF